jgi:hypothetical protein
MAPKFGHSFQMRRVCTLHTYKKMFLPAFNNCKFTKGFNEAFRGRFLQRTLRVDRFPPLDEVEVVA